jgi:import inner membrane translocase subunit TIM21
MVRQSGNLLIVVAGAGLFVVLAIALSTELFAKNSPSVLYSECIDMIRGSDAVSFDAFSSV